MPGGGQKAIAALGSWLRGQHTADLQSKRSPRRRIRELDEEWDIERVLEAHASTLSLFGMGMGAFVDRRFFALPAIIMGFLLQHAMQGWCPRVPLLRRLGFRTAWEMEEERYALKVLRGDFKSVEPAGAGINPRELRRVLYAVRK